MAEQYIVLGAGGHAKVILDILELNGQKIAGLTDAGFRTGSRCMGFPVLGTDEILGEVYREGTVYAAMGIGHVGNPSVRNRVYQNARNIGFHFPNIVHPCASISGTVWLGSGNLFSSNCVVNAEAVIGDLCIINTAAVVEHEVTLGDGVHIAPRAVVLGQAEIGENTFIGAGSVILQGVRIGKNCIIGAGSIVLHDVEDDSVVVGNPGRLLRRR